MSKQSNSDDFIIFTVIMCITVFVSIILFPIIIITPLLTFALYRFKVKGFILTTISMLIIMVISLSSSDLMKPFFIDIIKTEISL